MEKKASAKSSLKISKNEKKQRLNSLIKVLRPKVYITDSSNFKRLVHELTGNGVPIDSNCYPPRSDQREAIDPNVQVIDLEEDDHADLNKKMVTLESSNSTERSAVDVHDSLDLGVDQACWGGGLGFPGSGYFCSTGREEVNGGDGQMLCVGQWREEWLAYLETWLLDFDDDQYCGFAGHFSPDFGGNTWGV